MNVLSNLRVHQRWFFAGCVVVGAAMSRLPFLAEPNGNMAVVPYLATWFGCGLLAGFLIPDRPWRWAAGLAIGPPLAGIALHPQMAALALITIPLLPVAAIPIIAGAYLGRLVSPGRTASPVVSVSSRPAAIASRLFMVFGMGLVASAIPLFFVSKASSAPFVVWIGVAAVAAGASVAWGRSGTAKGTGVAVAVAMAAFVTKVISDTITRGPDHNLLPFEMIFVIVSTGVPAVVVALLTQWAYSRRPAELKL